MNTLSVFKREVKAYFSSPIAYVVISMFLLITGIFFFLIFSGYARYSAQALQMRGGQVPNINDEVITRLFFNMSVILMFMLPMVTMRLLAEEQRSGTMEMLLTFPLRDVDIVLGKFFAAMTVVTVMMLGTFVYPGFIIAYAEPEITPIATGYLGMLLLAGCFVSVGMFMSSLTENQIVAAFTTFGIYLIFWVLGAIPSFLDQAEFLKPIMEHLALTSHLESYARGLLETKDIIFNVNFIFFGLFLTFLSLQTKRWRG